MRKPIAAAIALAAIAIVATFWWRGEALRRELAASIPPAPDTSAASHLFRARLAQAEQQARSGSLEAFADLAQLYHANGYYESALSAYQALRRLEPSQPLWPYALASLYGDYGQLDQAIPLLEAAIALDPDYSPARAQLDQAIAKTGQAAAASQDQQADPWLDQITLAYCHDTYQLAVAAASAQARGDRKAALALLNRAVEIEPKNAFARRQLGTALLDLSDAKGAYDQFNEAIALDRADAENWIALIKLVKDTANTAELDTLLASALAACPDSPTLHLERGRHLSSQRNYAAARDALKRSIQLRPQEPSAYIDLSGVHFHLGQLKQAEAALKAALAAEPNHPVALSALARYAIGEYSQAEAEALLSQALAHPRIPQRDKDALQNLFLAKYPR